jgi:hypothetical protein
MPRYIALARAASRTPRPVWFGQVVLPRKHVILPLISNDRLYSFHYSGFEPPCHNILSSSVFLSFSLFFLFNPPILVKTQIQVTSLSVSWHCVETTIRLSA